MEKTFGNLIDELCVTNQKIWACEDIKHTSQNDEEIAAACRKTNILNPLRNRLIQEIDELANKMGLNQQLYGQGSTKVYGKK